MNENPTHPLTQRRKDAKTPQRKRDPLEQTQELFEFLQGKTPEGYTIRRRRHPKLSADQAWTVIWYLGNQYWQVPDFIERCGVCGDLFNSENSGACLDYGKSPYHFCDNCSCSPAFFDKNKRNPDQNMKEAYAAK